MLFYQAACAGKLIAEFEGVLRKLAAHCNFGTMLNNAYSNRFVYGLRHELIKGRLLLGNNLTDQKSDGNRVHHIWQIQTIYDD